MNTRARWSRKGISPLIATVLLFAFAVALSTMLVSYLLDMTQSSPCDDVAIGLDTSPTACYSNGVIDFVLVNKGQTPLTSVKVRIAVPNKDIQEVQLASELSPGSATKANINYQTINPGGVTLTLVPIIDNAGSELFCAQQEIKAAVRPC